MDDSERLVSVCPLCYEAGHKKKDCPEKEDDPIRRCFHCNDVGHFKVNCPKRKNKGDALARVKLVVVQQRLMAQSNGVFYVWKWVTSRLCVQGVEAC